MEDGVRSSRSRLSAHTEGEKHASHALPILHWRLAAGFLCTCLTRTANADVSLTTYGFYNTGYDGSGHLYVPQPANTVSPIPQIDAHYVLSAPPPITTNYAAVTNPASPNAWVPNDGLSNWLTPLGYQNPPNYNDTSPGWPETAPPVSTPIL